MAFADLLADLDQQVAEKQFAEGIGADPRFAGLGLTGPISSIEDLIRQTSPAATRLLGEGTQRAVDVGQQATQAGIGGLQPFAGTQAFEEQAALLGAMGPEAQQAAIAGIPLSEADIEQQQLERRRLLRQAAGRGRLGAGATRLELADLGASQQGV
jgi:hypothetical protein